MDVVALGPEATQKWIVDNMARWGKVVKDNGITSRMKLAILDDYQRLALEYADWESLQGRGGRLFSTTPSPRRTKAASELEPFDIVCLMRERTPFPRALIEKLPNLKFVSLTGARSPSLDTQALKERGIPVSNTRSAGGGLSTVELTWGLIIAAARGLAKGERNMRAGRWHEGLPPGFHWRESSSACSGSATSARGSRRSARLRHGMRRVEPEPDARKRRRAPARAWCRRRAVREPPTWSPSTSCSPSARAASSAPRTWRG